MQPLIYVVVPFSDDIHESCTGPFGTSGYRLTKPFDTQLMLFSQRNRAEQYANLMASHNGGRTYIVCEATNMFFTASSPTKQKAWKAGELLPV